MSQECVKAAAEQAAGAVPGNGSNAPAGAHGELHVITQKMEQSTKLLAELAEHAGRIAPDYKRIFEEARAAIDDFGTVLQAPGNGNGHRVTQIVAPMPGVIMRCEKKVGEEVKKGDVVVILDAMKVENPIKVPVTGKLISIRHGQGERVAKGSVLAVVNQ